MSGCKPRIFGKAVEIFGKDNMRLIGSFLSLETVSYPKYTEKDSRRMNKEGRKFRKKLLSKICNAIEILGKGTIDYVTIESLSNPGLVYRSLTVTPADPYYGMENKIRIILCICGNIECWGTVWVKPLRGKEYILTGTK